MAFLTAASPLAVRPSLRGAALCHSPVAAASRRRATAAARRARPVVMVEPSGEDGPVPVTPAAVEEARATTPANAPATKEPQKQTVFGALVFAFIMGIMALGLVATLARGFVPDGLVGPA
ncbi:hypothetical protein BU14_0104s0007 [Porphyra umbilicalis]|uniref:Uncharacterized protein n=1 Tax=Porphyra umbilicalis TaxID=2786 RepID=A0A1X6PDB1_PORUM|nr:hypothetical protein BU14_0104s0007 [Porphyra umbilicalis]|eukprot:OSX78633.1 hypothetical protein BU14_0104s0007 [Porphyra umbilicalis]